MAVHTNLSCDYLVVGAGASALAFVDTLLAELPDIKIILVDKHPAPGGHWNDAYDFVRLHQPSVVYGVSSAQLEGNWLGCILKERTLPWTHRATKVQLLSYFNDKVEEWMAKGQVEYYPLCKYDFDEASSKEHGIYAFSSLDGEENFSVTVRNKLVDATMMEPRVPSQCSVEFPVDEDIDIHTPNDIYRMNMRGDGKEHNERKYTVLGCGKTGMDTIVYLQREMGIDPCNINWIIPNDVWMLKRGGGGPWGYPRAILQCDGDRDKACSLLEKKGAFIRLDENVKPTRFRFPVVGSDELELLQKIKNTFRRGRVQSIAFDSNQENIIVKFGSRYPPLTLSSAADRNVIIHCCSPGPFNGKTIEDIFVSETEINLGLLFAPPISVSMSCIGFLEAARKKRALDVDFGRKALAAAAERSDPTAERTGDLTENDILKALVRPYPIGNASSKSQLMPIKLLAIFLSLADSDPTVVYEWMRGNRLSFFSIPGFKSHICDDLRDLVARKDALGLSKGEAEEFDLLSQKLAPLKGM